MTHRVIVSGMQGSGKTTLAHALGSALQVPVITLDTIKERLCRADLEFGRRPRESDDYSVLATSALVSFLEADVSPIILEGLWAFPEAVGLLNPHIRKFVEVFCTCPFEVARARFNSRAGTRAQPHDNARYDADEFERRVKASGSNQPLAIASRLVQVDTSSFVDVRQVCAQLKACA